MSEDDRHKNKITMYVALRPAKIVSKLVNCKLVYL
jgi:hypothetical protein